VTIDILPLLPCGKSHGSKPNYVKTIINSFGVIKRKYSEMREAWSWRAVDPLPPQLPFKDVLYFVFSSDLSIFFFYHKGATCSDVLWKFFSLTRPHCNEVWRKKNLRGVPNYPISIFESLLTRNPMANDRAAIPVLTIAISKNLLLKGMSLATEI
jgi:hypothetical protein